MIEVNLMLSNYYEECITSDYATAKLLKDLHKETSTLFNYHDNNDNVYYIVTWKKGR